MLQSKKHEDQEELDQRGNGDEWVLSERKGRLQKDERHPADSHEGLIEPMTSGEARNTLVK